MFLNHFGNFINDVSYLFGLRKEKINIPLYNPNIKKTLKEMNEKVFNIVEKQNKTEKYVVSEKLLGVGGSCAVLLAYRNSDCKQLACKVLKKDEIHPYQIKNELKISYMVKKLPLTTTIVDCIEKNDLIYIFFKYYKNGTLLDFYQKNKIWNNYLSESLIKGIITPLFMALYNINNKNITHRDIKLENILFKNLKTLNIVITDFGMASIKCLKLQLTIGRIYRV